ncbi:MAG: bacteriophage holin [Patescibacteria group bacterium]|jgi:hypothetical protein
MTINVKAFALSGDILWSFASFVLALLAMYLHYGEALVELMSSVYIGYVPGPVGAIVGAVWGFVDAAAGCAVFAWLYNFLSAYKR